MLPGHEKRCLNKVGGVVLANSVRSEALKTMCPLGTACTALQTLKPQVGGRLQVSMRHEERSKGLETQGLVQEVTEHEQVLYGTRALDRDPVKNDTV